MRAPERGWPVESRIALPGWVRGFLRQSPPCGTDEEKMRLCLGLARENVGRGSGGPFGAAVFPAGGDRPVAVGVNRVEPLHAAVLHAEVLALMLAQRRLRSHTLSAPGLPRHELFTSCSPCAMCLGASLWSGVSRIVCGARRRDAQALGFEEGPVFAESYRYLETRGVEIVQGLLADEAREVFDLYHRRGGLVYNG